MPKQDKNLLVVIGQFQGEQFIFTNSSIRVYQALKNMSMEKLENGINASYTLGKLKISLPQKGKEKFALIRNQDKILITKPLQAGGEAGVLQVVGEVALDKKNKQTVVNMYPSPKVLKERTTAEGITGRQINKDTKKEIKNMQAIKGNVGNKPIYYSNKNFKLTLKDLAGKKIKEKSKLKEEIKSKKQGNAAILMDIVPGKPLAEILDHNRAKTPNTANWAKKSNVDKLTLGLEFIRKVNMLHKLGVVHRDIQSKNVMYDEDNKNVTIIDPSFSLPEGKKGFSLQGAAFYMAPEAWHDAQITAKPSYDIFSAAAQLGSIFGATYKGITEFRENERKKLTLELQADYEKKLGVIKEKYKTNPKRLNEELDKANQMHVRLGKNYSHLLTTFQNVGYNFTEIADPDLKRLLEKMSDLNPKKRPTGDEVMMILMMKLSRENQQEFDSYITTSLKNELTEVSKNLQEEIKYQQSLPFYKKDKAALARLEQSLQVASACLQQVNDKDFSKNIRHNMGEMELALRRLYNNKWLKKDSPNTKRLLILQDNIEYMKPYVGAETTKRHSQALKRKSTRHLGHRKSTNMPHGEKGQAHPEDRSLPTPPRRQPPVPPPRRKPTNT